MVEQRLTSPRRNWAIGILFLASAYVGVCTGTAWYLKRSAQKILRKIGLLESQVQVQYFPFPVVSVNFEELRYKKFSAQGTGHFTPYLPGIFSGKYMKMIINATFKGEDLHGFYQEQSYFSPHGLNRDVRSLKQPKSTLAKLQTLHNLLQNNQNIKGSSKGNITFKTYQGTFHADATSSGPHDVQFEVHNGTQMVCQLAVKGSHACKGEDTHLETKVSLLLHPEVLGMANTLSRCITGQEMFTSWLLENQTRVQELFLPFALSFDVKGRSPTEKLKLFNEQSSALDTLSQTESKPLSIQPSIQRLKRFAVLPLDGTITITSSAAKTAQAQGKITIKQTLEAQNKNKLSCDIDLEWSSLLAHFAKNSPESYQNAEKLFAFMLKLINKHKTPERIVTHLHTTYDANTLAIEEFNINGMPFGQLLQAFFSNPEMHKHL